MKDNDCEVIEITKEQLKQISGGAIPPIPLPRKCANCGMRTATKGGFVVTKPGEVYHGVYFNGNWCDSCAEDKLQAYLKLGYTFVEWMPPRLNPPTT